MSDFGKETGATAIAATVAAQHREAVEVESEVVFRGEEPVELCGPLQTCWNVLVRPLLQRLDQYLDLRLVRTLERAIPNILEHRHSENGLVLSELGGFMCGTAHAPAGTNRLSNLLRSSKWQAALIGAYLWGRAVAAWEDMAWADEAAYLLWDESVIEKPESLASAGLCPVGSSKAERLSRIEPGYYRPPGARRSFPESTGWRS